MGFSLTVGVLGRPRATRVLRHLAVGAVTAAERSAREGGGMKLTSEVLADRATLLVHYQRSEKRTDSEAPPTSARRPAHSFRPPSLSEEVERILASHKTPYVPRTTPVPGSYRSSQPSVERTSDVQPVAPRSSPPTASAPRCRPLSSSAARANVCGRVSSDENVASERRGLRSTRVRGAGSAGAWAASADADADEREPVHGPEATRRPRANARHDAPRAWRGARQSRSRSTAGLARRHRN